MSESPPTDFPPPPDGWPPDKMWPPGRVSLDDAFNKLRWAKLHVETLRSEIEPFEKRDTHTISFEVDADKGQYTFYIDGLEEPSSDDWGLRIGDCLHNTRTALDYLMVRLYSLITGQYPRYVGAVQFPIYDEPGRFAGAVSEVRKKPAFSGYLARIEELQPFNRGNASIWGSERRPRSVYPMPTLHALPIALNRLSLLDNIDKHRVIHATWQAVRVSNDSFSDDSFSPADFQFSAASLRTGPLENGTKIGTVAFRTPLPHEWEPDQVDMKRQFPVVVSIYDEAQFAQRVLEVLPFCLWGVESVLTLFEPVFSDSKPPLPVTAIPNIPTPVP